MENQVVAAIFDSSIHYIFASELADVFNKFTESFSGFESFCKNQFSWRCPNSDMLRFDYDPMTGQEIDWDKVFEENKIYVNKN